VQFAATVSSERYRNGKSRVLQLQGKLNTLAERLIGLRFSLQDRLAATKEDKQESEFWSFCVQDLKTKVREKQHEVSLNHLHSLLIYFYHYSV
jgi:hypothetical protein